jgi:lia operon protein LiaG
MSKKFLILIMFTVACFSISIVSAQMTERKTGEPLGRNVLNRYGDKTTQSETAILLDQEIPSSIDTIEFDTGSSDIFFSSTSATGRLQYKDKKEYAGVLPTITFEKNTLKIQMPKRNTWNWTFQFPTSDTPDSDGIPRGFHLNIPSSIHTIIGSTHSGDVMTTHLQIRSLNIETSSGDILVKDSMVERLLAKSSSGDQSMQGDIQNIIAKTSSGDQSIKLLNSKTLNSQSRSGDVFLQLETLEELNAETSSGDIDVHGAITTSSLKSSSGDVTIHQSLAAPQLNVVTRSGDVQIQLTDVLDANVNFSTRSGDLRASSLVDLEDGQTAFQLGSGKGLLSVRTSSGDFTISKK